MASDLDVHQQVTPKRKLSDCDTNDDLSLTPLRKKIQSDFDGIEKGDKSILTKLTDCENNDAIKEDLKIIRNSLVSLNSNFNSLNNNFTETKTSLIKLIEEANTQAKTAVKLGEENKLELNKHSGNILVNTGNILQLQEENHELKERLIKLDSVTRRNQLIFDGIIENEKESGFDLYNKICAELQPIMGEESK